MTPLANWLADTSLSRFLAGNAVAFPIIEIAHVLAISLVLGTVFIFDLRLVGWAWREWPAMRLLATLRPFTLIGFAGAAVTGALMFAAQPVSYAGNLPFQVKIVLLGLAGLNVLLFHGVLARSLERSRSQTIPAPARLSAFVSLLLWIAILFAGRFIGFFLQG